MKPVWILIAVIIVSFFAYAYYDSNRRITEPMVRVQHILIKKGYNNDPTGGEAKKKIDEIYQQLKAGADFAELARKESQDPGSARAGGDLGEYILLSDTKWDPAFHDMAFKAKQGEISEPFQTAHGWHVLRVIVRLKVSDANAAGAKAEATPASPAAN